jgi:aspartate dehydrogenase
VITEASKVRKVGIIGCGAIGALIAEAAERSIVKCDGLILYDVVPERAETLGGALRTSVTIAKSLEEMIKLKPAVIVEAASQQAARDCIGRIVTADIDLIVMSVGALLELNVKSSRIHVPSGAIGGLDALSSAELAGIDEIILTTRKSPKILDLDNREEKLVYEGNAEEAVKRFPREMNVAATLALTVPREKVKVQVISDPKVKRNVHEVRVKWKHGDMFLKFENEPHPDNPKTSALAAWSAIKLLKDLLEKRA